MKIIKKEDLIMRESFSMAFGGGEIWFEQLDALSVHKDIVMNKFYKDLEIMRKPSSTGFIAVNLNETLVDAEMAETILELFSDMHNIRKVVFVGVSKEIKKLMNTKCKKLGQNIGFIYTFINDYEMAKEWLVH